MTESSLNVAIKTGSFRQCITISIVVFTFISLISTVLVTGYFFVAYNKKLNDEIIISLAKTTANVSIGYLINNDHKTLTNRLSLLNEFPNINYIHVYKLEQETEEPIFFASYNSRDNVPVIPNQISKKERISTPTSIYLGSEFILPIQQNNQILGYVYIQISDNNLKATTTSIILIVTGLVILFIALAFFISYRLSNKLNSALNSILLTIQQSSQDKDYTLVCPPSQYKEVDKVVRNINVLLHRTNKHLLKLSEMDVKNKKITLDLEEKINKRTNALKESNQELLSTLEKLHQFQGQIVENKKMASLGDMVAGIAHEINTPIGLGITSSTLINDRLAIIQLAFNDKTLKSSDLKKFIHDGKQSLDIIYGNLKRAADLISSFKKVAVDQSNADIRTFNVDQLMQEILLTLEPQIYNTPYTVNIDCPKNLNITSKPGSISQVIINLILNSIIHGFENRDSGSINISIMLLSQQLHIHLEDNGKGIDQSIINKIFEPFTTTKRGKGGSGLGLHLVYNIITQALGGNITLDKTCKSGVNFNMYFPIEIKN